MKFLDDKKKQKIDENLTKIEKKGFNLANKVHKGAVNVCLLFIGYQVYSLLKEYNNYFLNNRKIKKL